MKSLKRKMSSSVPAVLSSWWRSTRASVSIEFVAGSVLFLAITTGSLDIYRLIEAKSLGTQAANTMAEYMSLASTPPAKWVDDLAKFSHQKQIGVSSKAAFVISAITKSDQQGATSVQWDREVLLAPKDGAPPTLVEACGDRTLIGKGGALPTELAMTGGETVMVVEVCVKPGGLILDRFLSMKLYQYRIVPVRADLPTIQS